MRLLVVLFLSHVTDSLSDLGLSFTPKTIGKSASYEISFIFDQSIPGTSSVKLIFPSDVSIADSTSVSCTVKSLIYNPTSQSVSCSVSSRVYVIKGAFGTTSDYVDPSAIPIVITLPGIVNPSSTSTTNPIGIYINDPDGNELESEPNSSKLMITASPGSLDFASISTTSDIIGMMTSWKFTISTTFTIPTGSFLQVSFPFWNSHIGASSTADLAHFIRITNPSSVSDSNIGTSLSSTYSSSSRYLKITGGFDSARTGSIAWVTSSVYNPPGSDAVTGFEIIVFDNNSNEFLKTDSSLAVQVSTPNVIDLKSSAFAAINSTVSTSTSGFLTFSITNPTYSSVILEVVFPTEISIGVTSVVTGITGIQTSGLLYTISSNTIKITNGWSSYNSKTSISIRVDPITTASSTSPTGSFTVTTYSPNGNKIDTGTGGSVTARAGVIFQYLSNSFVTATDLTVGGSSTYTFDMWLSHAVPAGGSILITFPNQISIVDRSSSYPCTSIISGLSAGAFCQVSSRNLTIIGGFKTDFSGGRVSFSIDQITNPSTTATTSSFLFYSKTSPTSIFNIDTRTSGVTFTAAAALLTSASVSPSSLITGASSVYTFTIVTKNSIPASGYLLITFPSEITGWSDSSALNSCTSLTGFPSSITCSLSSSKVIVSGFSTSFSPGTLSFSMSNLINAPSTAQSSSFSIVSLDSSGFSIDQRLTGVTVTLTTANTFTSVSVSTGSLVNGATSDYSFTFSNKLTMPTSSYVEIYGPETVTLPSSPSCSVVSGLSSVLCISVTSNFIKATLSFSGSSLAAGSSFAFKVLNGKNPGNTKPSESFKVYSFTSLGDKIEKMESGVTVTMSTAATISQITIAAVDSKIAASTAYIITYLPMNIHPAGTVVFIEIPTELIVNSLTCEAVGVGISSSTTCSRSGYSLTITSAFESDVAAATSVTFKIKGITNPSTQITTSAWSLLTKTSDSYLIDKSNSITSSFTCESICLTCTGLPSNCTSCDQGSGYPYLYDLSCFSKCKDGYTDDSSTSDKLCVACSNPCLTCSGSISKCTSCDSSKSNPYLYSDTCNSNCQDGYWGNGTHCILCTNPCKTCSSSSNCLTCAVSSTTSKQTYLLSGVCYAKCPDGYTSDSSSNTCVACQDPCKTCTDTVSTCASCKSPYKLLSTSCVESCPNTGKYIETDSLCDPCVSPCDTCAVDTISCTSCISNYYLFDSSCLTTCPLGYAAVIKNCLICISPCEYCSGSQKTCTTCIEGYLLQINECVDKCSTGYFQDGSQCSKCDTQCSTCTGASSYCTSCSNFKYVLEGSCLDSCPSSAYLAIDKVCTLCTQPCATCSGSLTFCTSCTSGMYLYSNECFSECPAQTTVASEESHSCEQCNSNCKTCKTNVNNCLTCESPKYLQAGSCVSSCSNGYFLESGQCNACFSSCSTCIDYWNKCTSCSGIYSLMGNNCVTACPQGYSKINKVCVEVTVSDCADGCPVSILNNSNCDLVCNTTSCANDNGNCLRVTVACGSNKYEKDGSCFNCSDPCNNCIGQATYCTSCKADKTTGALQYLYNGGCLLSCPDKTFISGITCQDCDEFCESCVFKSSTCTSCVTGYKLYNNQCVFNCPSQTSVQVDSLNCYDCDGKCKYCSTLIDNCTECYSPLVLQDWNCVPYCNSGYFNNSGKCVACEGCKECKESASICTQCNSPLYLISGKCVTVCPQGTFHGTSECETCGKTCKTCSDKSSCDSCSDGTYLFENSCISQCPSGYVVSVGVCVLETSTSPCNTGCTNDLLTDSKCDQVCNTQDCNLDNQQCNLGTCGSGKYSSGSICESCSYPCQECTSLSVCTSCAKSISTGELLLLKNSSCIEKSTCNSGYTQVGVFCMKCSEECKECNKKTTTCVTCPSGKFLYEGTCISSCPSPYTVAKNSVCLPCFSNCLECSGVYDNCVKCNSSYVLQGSICQPTCDTGYTVTNESPSTCQSCTNNCTSCSSKTSNCLSCHPELFLSGSSCIDQCPKETTIQVGTNCLPCSSNCKTCRNSVSQCLTCISGYYLHQTTCVATCPEGYEPRLEECSQYCAEGCSQALLYNSNCDKFCNTEDCLYDNSICLGDSSCPYGQYQSGTSCSNCSYPCNTCVSSVYCTSCSLDTNKVQLLLYDGKCYLNCPNNTYKDLIQCKACDSSCFECSGSAKKCTSCSPGRKLYQDSCYSSCPQGKTVEVNSVCYDCDSNCVECSGVVTNCTKCLSGLVLSKGSCKSQCASGFTLTESSPTSCVPCIGCLTCLGSEYFCLSCSSGKLMLDGFCYSSCPAGYTNTSQSSTQCLPCDTNCKECKDKVNQCTACYTGKVLNIYKECVDPPECPSGQFSDSNGICKSCSSNCTECFLQSSNCTECKTSYFLSNSLCLPCSSNCLNCKTTASFCIECKEEFYLNNGKCIACQASCKTCENSNGCSTCKSGLFLLGSTCFECSDSCYECSMVKDNCTSCELGFYLSSNQCFQCDQSCVGCAGSPTFCTKCLPGKYGNSNGICTSCSSSCKECEISATNCTSCSSGKTLIKGVCDFCKSSCASCIESFTKCASCFNDDFIIGGECGKCQNNCKTCENSFSKCTSCSQGYFLSGSSCLSCDSSCKTCENSSKNCLSCDSSKTLLSNTCVVCDSNCLTCINSKSECNSCVKGKYLSNGECFECDSNCTECFQTSTTCLGCVSGLYLSGNDCLPCSYLCKTCQVREDFCTSCPSGSSLKSGKCVVSCKDGTVQVGLECQPCNDVCKTCIGTVDKCSSCSTGLVFNNSCVMECPESYFSSKGLCIPCSVNCLNCTEKSTKCTSCPEGFNLKDFSCEFICPDGQYEEGGVCLDCDAMCETCYKSSIQCTKCAQDSWVLMDDGLCTAPCKSGEVRVKSSRPCEPCSQICKTCSKTTTNCTTCSDNRYFIYNGSCISECPENFTIISGNKCLDCSSNCRTCLEKVTTCTSCPDFKYLLGSSCVDQCPTENYIILGQDCVKCKNPNCSESSSSNSSNNSTVKKSSSNPTFQGKPVPFPFSGISFASVGIIGLTKLASSGVQVVTSTIALWSGLSAVSWVFIAGYLPAQGESGDSRRLVQDDAVGGNAVLTVAFFLVLGALVFHLVCNVMFMVHYIRKVYIYDRKYLFWRKNHLKCNLVILVLAGVVSFHTIRLKFSGIFGYSGFLATYEDQTKVIKPLVFYGYISVLCTFIPVFIAELLILTDIDTFLWLWMFTLDSLILTFILGILIIFDIKRRESELMKKEYEKKLTPGQFEPGEFLESSHSIKELIEMFPHLDLTSLVPLSPTKRPVKKHISKSNPESSTSSPKSKLQRTNSFPLLVNDFVEVFPETLKKPEPPANFDEEPFGEEILNKSEEILDKSEENDELTMIIEEPEEPREFEVMFNECKLRVTRPQGLFYRPLDLDDKINEFTEIVAFTEEDEPSIEEPVLEEEKKEIVEQFDFENQAEPAKMSKKDLLELTSQESNSEIKAQIKEEKDFKLSSQEIKSEKSKESEKSEESEKSDSEIMAHIKEEKDIELEKAIADPNNPDLVSVLHKPTGKRIVIRKGFKGARIVDLENKNIESLPPVDLSNFDKTKTKVDEEDVRFATLTAKTGEKVRVKRSFKGARIVDLEKKVNNPNHFLIGETVKNEKDFQFTNAFPDPDDPEVVVVMHNETGEDVKIRKTFDGAQVIDEAGELVPNVPGIDRNDFDIPRAVIDKDDVHIATLNHKLTNQRVKVRRNFKGAKIIDLERKAEFPKVLPSASEKSDEPEPLSPFAIDEDDFGWVTPSQIVKRPVKNLKPINISKRNDDNYDRRKLANLANLIEDLDDDPGWDEASFSSGSSEGFSKKKQFYHNIDLNQVSVPDYDSDSFDGGFRGRRKKIKRKKRVKKVVQPDFARNKELEDIYLQRLEAKDARDAKKKQMRMTGEAGLYEPDWERTDSGFDLKEIRISALDRTLPHAGEEIINPRFKFSNSRRD